MMSYPLRERKKILERIINEETGSVELVQYKELFEYRDIFEEFDKSMLRNEEGIILKDPNSIYVPKERA